MSNRATWKEVHRQAVGVQTGGGRSGPWFCVAYRVTEGRMEQGKAVDYRERVETGCMLRASDYPDAVTLALMQCVATGADTLSRLCEAEDEKRRKSATSRRKSR